jgi:hypothetical protein
MVPSGSSAIINQKKIVEKYFKFVKVSNFVYLLVRAVRVMNESQYKADNISGSQVGGEEWRPREYIHTRMDVHGGRRGKRRTRGRSKRHHQRTILK